MRILILSWLADPNIALCTAAAGLFLVDWELCAPGLVIPGSLGGAALLVSIYALAQRPWRAAALVLLLTVPCLIYAEARWPLRGVAAAAGALCLASALVLAYAVPPRITPVLAAVVGVTVCFAEVALLRIALLAARHKALP